MKDGEVHVTGLPCHKGEDIELILLIDGAPVENGKAPLTASRLRHSGLVGLWKDRTDFGDSSAYAQELRRQAQARRR